MLAYRGQPDRRRMAVAGGGGCAAGRRADRQHPARPGPRFRRTGRGRLSTLSSRTCPTVADELAVKLRDDHIRVREAGGQRVSPPGRGPRPETRRHPRRLRVPAGWCRVSEFSSLKIVGGLLSSDLLGRSSRAIRRCPGTSRRPTAWSAASRSAARRPGPGRICWRPGRTRRSATAGSSASCCASWASRSRCLRTSRSARSAGKSTWTTGLRTARPAPRSR